MSVQIPSKAVTEGDDLSQPLTDLLQALNILGAGAKDGEKSDFEKANGVGSTFTGPPQSVALIEAGATAVAKWWATGLGAAVIAIWANVIGWWNSQAGDMRLVVVGSAAIVTAALIVTLGYLLASDVRGRAAAAVATIEARARLGDRMIQAAEASYTPAESGIGAEMATKPALQVVSLPVAMPVRYQDDSGWLAVAMEVLPGGDQYVVVKGSREATVPASDLEFLGVNGNQRHAGFAV